MPTINLSEEDAKTAEFVLKSQMAEMLVHAHKNRQDFGGRLTETKRDEYRIMANMVRQLVKQRRGPGYVPLLSMGVPHGGRVSEEIGVVESDPGASITTEHGQNPA